MREIIEVEGFTFFVDRSEPLEEIRKKLTHFYHWARHRGEVEAIERMKNESL